MKQKLTVLLPIKNEAGNIRKCIESVRPIADELLVADSGSCDDTLKIVRRMGGCRIIERKFTLLPEFRNWAIPQARHPWVLLLDADERLTQALADEILQELASPRHHGYTLRRINYWMGHPIRYGAWYPDRPLRLFRRDLGRFVGPNDHAGLVLSEGTVGAFSNPFLHYTCWSLDQYLPKVSRYARVQAGIWHEQGRKPSFRQLALRGPLRFLHSYVLKLGFLDGLPGVMVSAIIAYQSFLKQARLWEISVGRSRGEVEGESSLLADLEAEGLGPQATQRADAA